MSSARRTSTPFRRRTSRIIPATGRRRSASRVSSAGTPWPWSSTPTICTTAWAGIFPRSRRRATLYEVALQPFFPRRATAILPATWFISRATLRRAFMRAPFWKAGWTNSICNNFRQELAEGGGLSSYPHPYLMPDFWQFPTVSMGLGPIMSIYQARFNRYLQGARLHQGRGAQGLVLHRRRRNR